MTNSLGQHFESIRIDRKEWSFIDLRINIPQGSFGSDAINPHTQYSNPIAIFEGKNCAGIGASFTLGEGNDMVCQAADFIVQQLDGLTVGQLIASEKGFYEQITNPLQLRWLSPNAGIPMMAAGLVVNTLIDAAAKQACLPAWEFLARLPSNFLLNLLQFRHLKNRYSREAVGKILDKGLIGVDDRCSQLHKSGIPVYYTTWIGHDADTIAGQIMLQHSERGINQFKIKISSNIDDDIKKIKHIASLLPKNITLCVDANQTLCLEDAKKWLVALSEMHIVWLEEPFAPDNIAMFSELISFKKQNNLNCEIVTGENCPNHYIASGLIEAGIDRFQSDPCRMLGLLDTVLTSSIARIDGCMITPHAGGSSLDELSPHIQLFNLARINFDQNPLDSLTENVGFCSKYFEAPTVVDSGIALTPRLPGLLVGLSPRVSSVAKNYKEGISWLEL
jgi:L-fuconate dehydratase